MSVLVGDRRAPRQWTRGAAGLAVVAWLGLAACSPSPEAVPPPRPLAVTVAAVARRAVPVYGQYVGQTAAVRTVEIRARVEGFLERQVAPDGADVQQARANLERDLAQLENARTQEQRYRTLVQQELIAREQYDQIRTSMIALEATVPADRAAVGNAQAALAAARATIENARAVIRAGEAAVDSARLQLGYTTIRSPLDGRMGRADVRAGSLVGRSDSTLLATVSTLDPMHVNFSVSDREALQVWRRRQAALRARAGTASITLTLPDDSPYPHYVRLRVLLEERPDALLVPQAAVQESQGSASVFVVGPDRTVQARTVRLGPRFETLWVVEDGVQAGEQVIVKGLQQIRAGMRVEPTLETVPPAPAGG